MEVLEVTTVSDLLDHLRLSHPRWQFAQVITPAHIWIFRGQGDARWKLMPKSLRSVPNARAVGGLPFADELPLPWRAAAQEFHRLQTFLDLADEIGILPHPRPRFPDYYSAIREAAQNTTAPAPGYTEDLLEAFALAQHHGIATRLLDWSASPLTAAFFAAQDAFESTDDRTSFAIWAMPRQRPGDTRIRIITPSRTLNRFAHRQTGYLSLDLEVDKSFEETRGWPCQDEVLEQYHSSWNDGKWPCLRKIVVPKSCAADLLLALYQEDVSSAHLMPTLDNVVQTMSLLQRLQPARFERFQELLAPLAPSP